MQGITRTYVQKKTVLKMAFLAVFQSTSYVCSFTYFFHCLSFLPCIGGPYKIFMFVFQQKKVSLVFFISRSRSLAPFFWLSFAGLPPLFLCLSLALYSKSVDMTIYLSLILQTTRMQKQFPLSSLLTLLLSLLYKTLVAMRFPAKITSSCIWVAIPVD